TSPVRAGGSTTAHPRPGGRTEDPVCGYPSEGAAATSERATPAVGTAGWVSRRRRIAPPRSRRTRPLPPRRPLWSSATSRRGGASRYVPPDRLARPHEGHARRQDIRVELGGDHGLVPDDRHPEGEP